MIVSKEQIQFVLGKVYDARIEKKEPNWRHIAELTNKKFKLVIKITGDDCRDIDDNYVNLRSGLAKKPVVA